MTQGKLVEKASEHSTSLARMPGGAGTRDTVSNMETQRVMMMHLAKRIGSTISATTMSKHSAATKQQIAVATLPTKAVRMVKYRKLLVNTLFMHMKL